MVIIERRLVVFRMSVVDTVEPVYIITVTLRTCCYTEVACL